MKYKTSIILTSSICAVAAICGFFFWDTKENVDNFTKGPPLVSPGFIEQIQKAVEQDPSIVNDLYIGAPTNAKPQDGFYIYETPNGQKRCLNTSITQSPDGTYNIITARSGEQEVLEKEVGVSLARVNTYLDRLYFGDQKRKVAILKRVRELNKISKQ